MSKRFWIIFATIFIVVTGYFVISNGFKDKHISTAKDTGVSNGTYVLSTPRKIIYLSNEYQKLSETSILGGWEIEPIHDGKVYVSIRGNPDENGQEIAVFKNGVVKKDIKLTYNMPTIIRYNKYNKKAYIGHVGKITYHNENCITVVDTTKDTEEKNIMFDRVIEDIAFSSDNKMYVSSWNVTGGDDRISVFDLKTDTIIASIPTDVQITSMVYIESTGLIYGATEQNKDPHLYIIDWKKQKIVDKITLEHRPIHKLKLFGDDKEKEYLYVSHYSVDDDGGKEISIIDPDKNKIINQITNAVCPVDFDLDRDKIFVCDKINDKVHVLDSDGKLIKDIDIKYPISIAKSL